MRHKHAELIHAFAEGAEIQVFDSPSYTWVDCGKHFVFCDHQKYRVKPKPDSTRYLVLFNNRQEWRIASESQVAANVVGPSMFQVKVVSDGETGNLKSAEVLK